MDENYFKEKLRRIEALFAGAATPGERDAASAARERILARLKELQQRDPAVPWKFQLNDGWAVKVFCSLYRRYGLRPYRKYRQRRTTVMIDVPRSFVEQTLWPEFKEASTLLQEYLTEVTDRLISTEIHKDTSDAEEVPEDRRVPSTTGFAIAGSRAATARCVASSGASPRRIRTSARGSRCCPASRPRWTSGTRARSTIRSATSCGAHGRS